jgi:hypothetical protein
LASEYQGRRLIPSIAYERYVVEYLPHCFQVLNQLGATTPVAISLTLIGTSGLWMAVDEHGFERGYPIRENILALPESVVHDFSISVGKILKPLFDLVWNACGFASSKNFDAEGKWIARC